MLNTSVFKNSFGQTYKLNGIGGERLPRSCKLKYFSDSQSAKRFLLDLNLSTESYRRLAHTFNTPTSGGQIDLLSVLSKALIQGRFSFVEVKTLDPIKHPPSKRILGKGGSVKYRFEESSTLLISSPKESKTFHDVPAALSFIANLGASDKELYELAESLPLSTPISLSSPSTDVAKSLAEKMVSQDVAVIVERPMMKTKEGGSSISEEVTRTAERSVPLAPPTLTTWIEVALLDDDGEPVADEPYLIIDSEDNEFKGVTNAKGEIRVTGIPKGVCKVTFPEIEGSGISGG